MDEQEIAIRIQFDGLTRGEANREIQELRQVLVEQVDNDMLVSIEREDADSQDAGSTLVLLFGSSAAVAVAQGIRAYLSRRSDSRDRIMIRTKDGTEVVATGEAARTLDAAALVRAAQSAPKKR